MSPMASLVDTNTALGVQSQNNQMHFNATQAGYNAQAGAQNYNRMLMGGSVSNVANAFAMPLMMQGYQQMGLFGKPNPSGGS